MLSLNKCRRSEQRQQEDPRHFVTDGLRRVLVNAFHGDFPFFPRAFLFVLNQTCEIELDKGQSGPSKKSRPRQAFDSLADSAHPFRSPDSGTPGVGIRAVRAHYAT